MTIRFGLALFLISTLSLAANHAAEQSPGAAPTRALAGYAKLPLRFEENRGQAGASVRYLSRGNDYSIFLTPAKVYLNLKAARHSSPASVGMSFPGASSTPAMAASERQSSVSSYFFGQDPSQWIAGAPNFARVHYRRLYPGIDLAFYGNQGKLEYDFLVAPGADPHAIRLQFDGVRGLRLDGGDLVLETASGEIRQHKPLIYQQDGSARRLLQGGYVLQPQNRVAFEMAAYDTRKPLIIDPVLSFSTYLGSSGDDVFGLSAAADTTSSPAVATDTAGNVYVTGYNGSGTSAFTGNPKILTAPQGGGGGHVFLLKISPAGALVYAAAFGGANGNIDIGGGVAADSSGNAYVTGSATSPNFPITPGAPQNALNGGTNAFVTKINPSGTSIVYSTYLGGSGNFWGRGIAVDHSGNAYVTGTAAFVSGGPGFPLVNPIAGSGSGFLTEVNSAGTAFAYSTYLSAGIGYGVAVDGSGAAYVAGTTAPSGIPTPAQGYALKVNPGGTGIAYTAILGSSGATLQTIGFGIALDSSNNAYVTGATNDPSFPEITSGAPQKTFGGGISDAFAVKLNPSGSLIYGTYIGGIGSNILPERGSGIGVDSAGNAYVGGTTQCIAFPSVSPIPNAKVGSPTVLMQGTLSGVNSTWSPMTIAGRFDQVDALAFDSGNDIYAGTSAVNGSGGGIFKLLNGQVAWDSANTGITTSTIDAIAVDPTNSAVVYAGGGGHLYKTTNGAAGWSELAQTAGTGITIAVAEVSSSSTIVYVGSSSGLIYSTNGGTSWSNPAAPPPPGGINIIVVDPNSAEVAYAGTPNGVYETINGGVTWTSVNTGLPTGPGGAVTGMAVYSGAHPSVIYAATPNGLFETSNASAGWTFLTLAPETNSTPLKVAVDHGDNVYLAFLGGGIATAINGGLSSSDWSIFGYNGLTQNQVTALAASPFFPGTAYAGIVASTDAFLTEINSAGTAFVSSTCIGGSDNNLGQDIAVTPGGSIYLSGLTTSTNFPVTPGAIQSANAGLYDVFVMGMVTSSATTITSSPSGASVTVSGASCSPGTYTTPVSLSWAAGVSCTVTFADPQNFGGTEYEFQSSTINGSSLSHNNPLTVYSTGGGLTINATYGVITGAGPGSVTHFSVTAPASATAGLPIQFTVTALNASNGVVTTYSDPVHFSSTDPAATLPADSTLTNGTGTFTALMATPGTWTISVHDLLSPSVSGTSGGINVSTSTAGLRFIAMSPCRVVDTRDGTKPPGFGPPSLVAGAVRSFTIPSGPCPGIPATAQAYALNVTVVPHGELGYLTVWPTGQPQPLVSTLNSIDGEVKANAAIVAAGTSGAISTFATNATDLVIDINGYFVSNTDSAALAFYPMTPCRLVDTRPGAPSTIVSGTLAAGSTTTLPIFSSDCHVPTNAQAYSLNFTLVPPAPVGYLTVYPTGEGQPIVSTLNDPTGTVEANAGIAPAGSSGDINVFVTNTTDLLVDINGYFAPAAAGALSLYTVPPCRVLDTRNPPGAPAFLGTINVDVTGSGCGGTSATQAYVFNATVVPQGFLGYLTLWPEGSPQPVVSTLNAYNGLTTSNLAIVPTTNTDISAYATNYTYLVLDLFGYFAP